MSDQDSIGGDSKSSAQADCAEVRKVEDATGKMLAGRLGSWGRIIVMLGWIVELTIFAFLFFMWYGEGAESKLWRWIMLNQLAAQAATLSSIVLQMVVDAQATVCTALVAALMLEARNVRITDIPLFSVLRAVNGGPSSIAGPLASSPRKFFQSWPAFLLLLLYITTLAMQFSSTILLTDFRQTSLLEKPTQRRVNTLATTPDLLERPTNASGYLLQAWDMASTTYPPFAEQVVDSPLEQEGLSDTGGIKRAFLPFAAHDRRTLRQYQGSAVTYESRVACSRPSVEGSLQFNIASGNYFPRIRGNVTWRSEEDFGSFSCSQGETVCTRAFDCPVPYIANSSELSSILTNEHPTSLCLFNETDQALGIHTNFSDIFLVLSSEVDYMKWLDFNVSNETDALGRYSGPSFPQNPTWSSNEWVGYRFGPVAELNMTLCQNTMKMGFENVTAAATVDLGEPALDYNATVRVWETDDILDLIDIGDTSSVERGIMKISSTSPYTEDDFDAMLQGSFNYDWLVTQNVSRGGIFIEQFSDLILDHVKGGVLTSEGAENYSVYFCSHCYMYGKLTDPHPSFSTLFHAIIDKTGSVAPAIQSILFWMAQTQYYNAFPAFDFGGNSTVVHSKTVNIPQHWNGLAAVAGIVFMNMACVAMIAWLFLRRTSYSKYGDIWHTIAQVLSPDLRHLLDRASRATDKQIKKSLEDSGSEDVDAGLYLLESGRVVALRNNAPFQHMAVDRMKTGLPTKFSFSSHTW